MNAHTHNIVALRQQIRACTACHADLPHRPRPVLRLGARARVLIIGQAPGRRAHESRTPWNDPSGDVLRAWMGVSRTQFYDRNRFAIAPMGFCYPGTVDGTDLPPQTRCAPLWHTHILKALDQISLTLLVGSYAQTYYPGGRRPVSERVRDWEANLRRRTIALPHPSWRTRNWRRTEPWFETSILPLLRQELDRVFTMHAP